MEIKIITKTKKFIINIPNEDIDELGEERRFTPDMIQDEELRVIRNAPLPGLAQQFKYYLSGTK